MSGNQQNGSEPIKLNTIEEAIADIKAGKVIIVVDDEDRENEGDFICAAECVTPEIITFMATHGRGLICTPIDEKRADDLELNMMVSKNTALHETAFTVSIDLIGQGCTTGISSYDRSTGIKALIDPKIKAADFARPGHIFPLRAKSGGVLRRTGHTEAAIDLARLAGYYPAGVLVEILNADGTMARTPQLLEIAKKHDLKMISIYDLVTYRMRNERLITEKMKVTMPTKYGDFEVIAYEQITSGDVHLAIKKGSWTSEEPVLVRAHSATDVGNVLGLLFEDYASQLDSSLKMIAEQGKGMILFMRHGDAGDTLLARLKSYQNLKESPEPNTPRTAMDRKAYGVGAQILREQNITKLRMISNNPNRKLGAIGYGLEIVEIVKMG